MINKFKISIILLLVFSGLIVFFFYQSSKLVRFNLIKEYDLSSVQYKPKAGFLIADIVIFHSKEATISWEELKKEYQTAYETFIVYGVQLNLVNAFQVELTQKWSSLPVKQETKALKEGMNLDFYKRMDYQKIHLHHQIESIFRRVIPKSKDASRTIYIITMSNLTTHWFEKNLNNQWIKVESKTSAVSFPPYMYADRIPKYFRGVISIQKSKKDYRTMSHEFGHKLINVSHEGLDKCPAGSGEKIPGLMGYGTSNEIFSGARGRWHVERLKKSPFLYRLENGKKVWNRDYIKGGVYDDPIYGGMVVKPVCPPKS